MDEFLQEEMTGGEAEFFLATVTAWSNSNGAKIRLDGQDTAMAKYYKTICGAVPVDARVIVIKKSGTYVVLGKLGGESTYITTQVSDIFSSITSGFTVSSATYVQYGKIAMFTAIFNSSQAGETSNWTTWAMLKAGKRPAAVIAINCQATTFCILGTNGAIQFSLKQQTNFGYRVSAVYILP